MNGAMVLAGLLGLATVVIGLPVSARGESFDIGARTESVRLGIHVGDPPSMVVVPGTPVYHAPNVPYNYFYFRWQYYLYHGGAWFVAASYNGPWTVVALDLVPPAVLGVPMTYYKVPPGHWKIRSGPPPWTTVKVHAERQERRENEP